MLISAQGAVFLCLNLAASPMLAENPAWHDARLSVSVSLIGAHEKRERIRELQPNSAGYLKQFTCFVRMETR